MMHSSINKASTGKPAIFEEFFGLGQEESASPFLKPSSRKWAANLTLKAALLAAFLLLLSFTLSFFATTAAISALLLLFVYFLAGIPALIESIEDLVECNINIDVLMTLAAFSSVLIGSSLEGALLLVLFAISGSIEDLVTAKAKGSINQLNKLSPTKATLITNDGQLCDRSIKEVEVGAVILVRPGEIVPLDGEVKEGVSAVNLVHLTGESLPVTKKIGDSVAAGARNLDGVLQLVVTHTAADSTLSKIVQLVTNAQEAKPKLQRWFDRFSRMYALSIISLSALVALSFPFLFSLSFFGLEGSIYRAVAFLIAASPCALILALPIAYLSAISACAKKGILLKGGVILDALASCSTIAFDKTGTLTTGELTCTEIKEIGKDKKELKEEEVLAFAYALEKNAVHPIAKAVNRYAASKKVTALSLTDFKSIAGYGLQAKAKIDEKEANLFMGHPDYIEAKITAEQKKELLQEVKQTKSQGKILAILLVEERLFIFTFEDQLRPLVKEAIHKIRQSGAWKLLMLTGDHEESAKRVAKEFAIEYLADLKPEDKLEQISALAQREKLIMVGDGINDAPALARANVGICMGKVGSGAALDAADVILLHDNLEYLQWLLKKAEQTQRIVKQNLVIALSAIVIAAIPALGGLIPLWLAVIMHEGGTVLVGLNGLRLLKK